MPTHAQVNLHCKDVGATFDYLTQLLGFTPEFRIRDKSGGVVFAGVWWGEVGKGTRLILGDIHEALHGPYDHGQFGEDMLNHPVGTGVVLYFFTENVDDLYENLLSSGALIDEAPTDQFWGDRTISVNTPDGYYLTFATPIPGFKLPPRLAERYEDLRPGLAAR
ncbi:MAG TPA: VOC family protein [Candidatus Thermoplasmatota archaeon]|nr:VOC family protein [Candidatus Thermoplasmatota archaeon]